MKSSLYEKKQFATVALLMLTLLVFVSIQDTVNAQTYTPEKLELTASAISDGTDITLRWMPADYETWKWGNDHGYRLERMRIDSNATANSNVIVDSNIILFAEPQWQPLRNTSDMAEVAHTLIFKDSLESQYLTGADFIEIYEAKRARESVLMFLSIATSRDLDVALAAGLAYVDTTADAGANYIYFIKPNNVPTSTKLEAGMCEMATDNAYLPPPIFDVSVQSGDSVAVIGWSADTENYTSYLIERSADNGATWEQINDTPYMSSFDDGENYITYKDSLSDNTTSYIYRVKGCSPFGLIGPESDTISVAGTPGPLEDGNPNVIDVEELTTGQLTINWEFPSSSESDIQGYDIYRSDRQQGGYEKLTTTLLPTSDRAFTDANPMLANYYKVVVVDINGYELPSVPIIGQLEDITPPSPPGAVTGSSSASGTVTLSWTESPEPDVAGYRVFISNQQAGDFTQISTTVVRDTFFRYGLNLNTLSEEVYFKVKAIDQRENMSDFSSVCTVERPDIIPPAPPSINNVQPEIGRVNFEWALSGSEDVVEYEFQRKPNGSSGWTTLLVFDADTTQQMPPTTFIDTTASSRKYWDYRLLARDDASLISSSRVIKAKPVDDGRRGDISNFTGAQYGVGVVLDWDYSMPDDSDLEGFQVFRSFDSNPMQSFQFVTLQDARSQAMSVGGSGLFAFIDDDLDFSVPVQTNYVSQNYSDATTVIVNSGGTVTQNGNTFTIVPTSTNTPVNPNTQAGVTINYWIMAKHMDGGFSPVSAVASLVVY